MYGIMRAAVSSAAPARVTGLARRPPARSAATTCGARSPATPIAEPGGTQYATPGPGTSPPRGAW
ncbi:hypothetical protein GCM10020001_095040 [Nonomuraea salmonea]